MIEVKFLSYKQGYGTVDTPYDNIATKTHSVDDGSAVWNGIVQDKAGNTNTCQRTIKFDKNKPTCSVALGRAQTLIIGIIQVYS